MITFMCSNPEARVSFYIICKGHLLQKTKLHGNIQGYHFKFLPRNQILQSELFHLTQDLV